MIPIVTPEEMGAIDAAAPEPVEVLIEARTVDLGFDPATVRDPVTPDDLELPCGRGLFLIRNLMDDVRFTPPGNSICMTLRRQ